MTAIILLCLFCVALYLVNRWDKMAQKKIDAIELDEFEKYIS